MSSVELHIFQEMCNWKWIRCLKCRPRAVVSTVAILSTISFFLYWDIWHTVLSGHQQHNRTILHADKWIGLANNVNIFSAFYDDRPPRHKPVIVVLGLEKQYERSTRYNCILSYKNNTKVRLKNNSPLRVLTRVHWLDGIDEHGKKKLNYRPFSFTCFLPTFEIPDFITIVPYSRSNIAVEINSDKFVLVRNFKPIHQASFGVCISSPIFNIGNPIQLINTFEMNRLLGANFFTVYIYQLPLKSRKILEKYLEYGLVEIVENWGKHFPGNAHYYGQLLSITDCLYRNMNRVKYLVYTDLDEIIMPLKHPDWSSLIKELDGPEIGSFTFDMVYLRAVQPSTVNTLVCPSGENIHFQSPRYTTFRNRSNAAGFTSKSRTKYITKTNVSLIAQIHYIEKLASGYVKLNVPVDIALVYHYRVPYKSHRYIRTWTVDNIVQRYLHRLSKAIGHVLCDL